MSISVPVSWGELLDKITILKIKKEKITDPIKLKNISHELNLLITIRDQNIRPSEDLTSLCASLQEVNERLWQIEDEIRLCEKKSTFGDDFVRLARAVYQTNDMRSAYKYQINILLDSEVVEEKSYQQY